MQFSARPEQTALLIEKYLSNTHSEDDLFILSNLISEYFHNIRLTTEIAIRKASDKPEHQQRNVSQLLPIERILKAYE
jgi:hypothetical protein